MVQELIVSSRKQEHKVRTGTGLADDFELKDKAQDAR
jgi:hypothetical protein